MASMDFLKFWQEEIEDEVYSIFPATSSKVYDFVKRAWENGYLTAQRKAQLPQSIQEALNSGDGVYRP